MSWCAEEDECKQRGVRNRGTLGDIDPVNAVPFKRAISRVKKGPLLGAFLTIPRSSVMLTFSTCFLPGRQLPQRVALAMADFKLFDGGITALKPTAI